MATYNGAAHVREQVDSILSQRDVSVRLVIRDDGSTDRTPNVLAEYDGDDRVVVRAAGKRLGLPWSYFELMQSAGADAGHWALADQDDIWLPDKLARAVSRLDGHPGPAMYCGRVEVTDESLRLLYSHAVPRRGPSFANALVQNIATGCTIVLNPPALAVVQDRWPEYAVMHDAWLYLVLSGVGTVFYDPRSSVLYRQHSANAVGMGHGPFQRVLGRVRRQLTPGRSGAHGRQDVQLARTHADLLREDAAAELAAFLASRRSLRQRLGYAVAGPAHRQTAGSDWVLKGLHVLGRV